MNKCPNCGANLPPGASRCIYCDHPIPRDTPRPDPPSHQPRAAVQPGSFGPRPVGAWGSPPGQGFGPSFRGQQALGWQPPPLPPPPPVPMPNFMAWVVTGFIQFFFCQLSIPALIGAIMAISAKSEWEHGAYDSALRKLRTVKILVAAGFAIIFLVLFAYVLLMVIGAVAAS